MQGQINPKIIGATIIGFALVASAFTVSSLQSERTIPQPAAVALGSQPRAPIAVVDNDNNGIEDWRDDFVTTEPVVLDQASSTYTLPTTLTGKTSIGLLENYVRSKNYGPFGSSEEEIITNTVNYLAKETEIKFYNTPDITIMETWDDQDILNYANVVASTIYKHNVADTEGELAVLYDILSTNNSARLGELTALSEMYKNYRDDTLLIPVPAFLVKEHLDLINTYHSLHEDIKAMLLIFDDPAVTLLRLKRYEDDTTGLGYALQNIYFALEPYAYLVTSVEEPATLFAIFSPDFNN